MHEWDVLMYKPSSWNNIVSQIFLDTVHPVYCQVPLLTRKFNQLDGSDFSAFSEFYDSICQISNVIMSRRYVPHLELWEPSQEHNLMLRLAYSKNSTSLKVTLLICRSGFYCFTCGLCISTCILRLLLSLTQNNPKISLCCDRLIFLDYELLQGSRLDTRYRYPAALRSWYTEILWTVTLTLPIRMPLAIPLPKMLQNSHSCHRASALQNWVMKTCCRLASRQSSSDS